MRPSAFDPPAIPPAFWERPDVCQALRQRDMSALFRLLQQYLGLSQMRIGTAVGLGQGRISEVINGIRNIRDTKVFERIADGLDMPDHARVLLGLTPRQITAPPPRSPPPPPARTPSCSGRSPRPGASTAPSSASCRARPTTSGSWTAASAPPPCGQAGRPHRPDRDQPAVLLRPGNRQQLARALADASALAGWQAIDMSRLPRAWAHFERATAAAREAADPCLLAFAAGEQAYVLLDLHRPAKPWPWSGPPTRKPATAIPHQVRSWLRAAEAEMAAAAGEDRPAATPSTAPPRRSATVRPARTCLTWP